MNVEHGQAIVRSWTEHCRLRDATVTLTCPQCGRRLWIIAGAGGGLYLLCECGARLLTPHLGNSSHELEWLHEHCGRIIWRRRWTREITRPAGP